jgi:hypothetical protein
MQKMWVFVLVGLKVWPEPKKEALRVVLAAAVVELEVLQAAVMMVVAVWQVAAVALQVVEKAVPKVWPEPKKEGLKVLPEFVAVLAVEVSGFWVC